MRFLKTPFSHNFSACPARPVAPRETIGTGRAGTGVEYSAYSSGVRRLLQRVPGVGPLRKLQVTDRSPKNSHTRNRRTWASGSGCC